SEEHTSELQSLTNFVCRLFLVIKSIPAVSLTYSFCVWILTKMGDRLRHSFLKCKDLLHVVLFKILSKFNGSSQHFVIYVKITSPSPPQRSVTRQSHNHRHVYMPANKIRDRDGNVLSSCN